MQLIRRTNMIVCLCHRISDRDIQRAVRDGIHDFEVLQDETCLARNCGCCEECARGVFEQALHVVQVHRPVRAFERAHDAPAVA